MTYTQRIQILASAATLLAFTACSKAPDLSAVHVEREKPVNRSDTFQAAASNGKVLVAGTAAGVVVSSSDGGRTWARHALEKPASVIALAACPDGSFVALDFYRKVWIADAAAQNWRAHEVKSDDNLVALTCDRKGQLWAVGARMQIASSADQGATWKVARTGEDSILTTIQFLDQQKGVITGEFGNVLTTADGGATWQKQEKIPGDFYPYSAVFNDAQRGWVSGLAGVILHTEDGGKSWNRQANQSGAPMYALLSVADELYGVGGGGEMVTLRGEQWVRFEHGKVVPAYLSAGAALDTHSLLVTGAAGALYVLNPPQKTAAATYQGVATP